MESGTTESIYKPFTIYTPICNLDEYTSSELKEVESTYGSLEEFATELKVKERDELLRKFRKGDILYGMSVICKHTSPEGNESYQRYRCVEEALEHTFYGQCTVGFEEGFIEGDTLCIRYASGAMVVFFAVELCEEYLYEDVHRGVYRNEQWYLKRLIEDDETIKGIGRQWFGKPPIKRRRKRSKKKDTGGEATSCEDQPSS